MIVFSFTLIGQFRSKSSFADASIRSPSTSPSHFYRIDEQLEGPQSFYTRYLIQFIRNWPPRGFPREWDMHGLDTNPVQLECYQTAGNPFYLGLRQFMKVNAPLAEVEKVLDNMDQYQHLFPGFKDIHVVSRDGNKILTAWEQPIPLFFVPNVRYELWYIVDKSLASRKIYRYQLKESNSLKKDDGLIVIQSESPNLTYYVEYDFYDADWGVLKTIAPSRIWKDNVEGIYLSDLAIKLRAEHSAWSFEKIAEESAKVLKSFPVEKAIDKKRPL